MNNTYIAIESLSLLVVLILIYANIFERKQHTFKKNLFTQLLVLDAVILLADVISWMKLGWSDKEPLLWVLVVITYIVPFVAQAVFGMYLYEHISGKTEINKRPFEIMMGYSLVTGIVSFVMCIAGKLFTIVDGKYYPGTFESIYYLLYLISLGIYLITIFVNGKKMGAHDFAAAILYCAIPGMSIILSTTLFGINLTLSALGIEVLVIYIMLQSESENRLFNESTLDELTGLNNRRAYEDDLMQYTEAPAEDDFVYASIDVNGLKQVNDTLGHVAGDEIIRGAAYCLKQAFDNYGKVYRIGGDEFAAILLADDEKLKQILTELQEITDRWSGNIVSSLSLSVGYATKREFPEEFVRKLAEIADARMYQAKNAYYLERGIDRRGQAAAYTALCNLYTKIFKINLTDNTYSIVNMNTSEKSADKGFSDDLAEYFINFGTSGQVHSDDLKMYLEKTDINYLKEYFKQGKTSISINYRRKFEDAYKQSAMEMILADDYSDDYQTLFLYVKQIDT